MLDKNCSSPNNCARASADEVNQKSSAYAQKNCSSPNNCARASADEVNHKS